jgi:WD40 repeat protein
MAETSALTAFSAVENNIKDAEADVKRITETKAKNGNDVAAANTAIDASKKAQDKATADIAALKEKIAKPTRKPIAVAFSADAQKVAALFDDGALNTWAVASGLPTDEVASGTTATTTLTAGPNGSFTATKWISLTTGAPPHWVLERVLGGDKSGALFADRVNAVRFSPDGKTIAVGGGEPSRSGDISLWDVASGKLLKNWPERHSDAVLTLDFSPDGKLLASGGADKLARVTEIASGKQVQLFEGHTHHVMGLAFRADGRVLATAGGDGVVLVWDMILGERKRKIEGWTKEVTALQYVGATPQIITSAGDNLVRIVNDDGTPVRTIDKLPNFMQAVASTANANVVVAGGEDSCLRVWDGTNGKELAVFQAK